VGISFLLEQVTEDGATDQRQLARSTSRVDEILCLHWESTPLVLGARFQRDQFSTWPTVAGVEGLLVRDSTRASTRSFGSFTTSFPFTRIANTLPPTLRPVEPNIFDVVIPGSARSGEVTLLGIESLKQMDEAVGTRPPAAPRRSAVAD
jgi:hypothetical protein